jgi:hypothetical protein
VIGFQYVSFGTANNNEMSLSAWLARQLRQKSDEIHRLRQQIRAYQMNMVPVGNNSDTPRNHNADMD